MFVCRQWALIISCRFLFTAVVIEKHETLDKFIKLIEENPELGGQVETLTLDIPRTLYFDIAKFLVMLPNLKSVGFCFNNKFDQEELEDSDSSDSSNSSNSDDSDNASDSSDSENGTNSAVVSRSPGLSDNNQQESPFIGALKKTKITTMMDYRNFNLTYVLLSSGLCPNLVSLSLDRSGNSQNEDIFFILKDLPVLKHLTIDRFPLSIALLETVHGNIPSLESLDLLDIIIIPSIFPPSISPTALVSRLKLDVAEAYDEHHTAEWLRYVSCKYTNLNYFYQNFDTCSAYRDIMPLLVRNCGTSLASLGFGSSVDEDFSVLRSIDTHFIEELDITFQNDALSYPILEQTQHFIHLKKLRLHQILPTRKLDKLKDIVGLELLDIEFINPQSLNTGIEYKEEDYELDIYTLFKSFPASLQSVDIKDVQLVFNYDDDDGYKLQFPQIKTFSLYMISLKTFKFDDFISKCLPNLRSLSMDEIYDFTHLFSIPNLHLSYLEISPYNCDYRFYDLCLLTKDCPSPHYHSFYRKAREDYSGLSGYRLPKYYDEINLEKLMVVVCGSVERLDLFGIERFLVSDKDKFKSL
jgi:hypothetical protein